MPDWQPIATAPQMRKIIVFYRNALGKGRCVMACYYKARSLMMDDDYAEVGESYEDGESYAPEGWYEEHDQDSPLMPLSEQPTHWMPLPAPPEHEEPPDAPIWYSAEEAAAWAAGWNRGREALLAASSPAAPQEPPRRWYDGNTNASQCEGLLPDGRQCERWLDHDGDHMRRESEPHQVSAGGTEADAEYWRRRNTIRREASPAAPSPDAEEVRPGVYRAAGSASIFAASPQEPKP